VEQRKNGCCSEKTTRPKKRKRNKTGNLHLKKHADSITAKREMNPLDESKEPLVWETNECSVATLSR
jgi:hypothetical protein